jgi:hypothetical protein
LFRIITILLQRKTGITFILIIVIIILLIIFLIIGRDLGWCGRARWSWLNWLRSD